MFKKTITIFAASFALVACAAQQPHIVQASSDAQEVHLVSGMATQIELPDSEHVRSVVVGKPALVSAEKADNVVNLIPKEGEGETNLIVRASDSDGETKVYQYRVIVTSN